MAKGSSKSGFMMKQGKGFKPNKMGAGMAPSAPSGPRSGGSKGPPSRKAKAMK